MAEQSQQRNGVALRPKARILRTLGEELISSETVAVLELVKNSYDADARVVLIKFSGLLEKGMGHLEVSDDGHGMDLITVERAWMEPATATKKKARHSQYLSRRLLGEKGVGRFAAARLADELELITRAAFSSREIVSVTPGTLWPDRLPAGNRPAQFTTRGAATWSEGRLGFHRQPSSEGNGGGARGIARGGSSASSAVG